MDTDRAKQAWQADSSQPRLTTDSESLLGEVRRNQRAFAATIFWRDVREVGTCLLMLPLWAYIGVKTSQPWTWYLAVPAFSWIAGFMLVDRLRHGRRPPDPGEPLRRHVEGSLGEVEHQIRMLRHVFWWYLLPIAVAMFAYLGQLAWRDRAGGWPAALALFVAVAGGASVLAGVYWLNRYAVRAGLEPRRRELEALLVSLADEAPEAS